MKIPTNHYGMVEVKGFEVVGFFFPFIRSIFGSTGTRVKIFYAFTFWAYPIWCWYMGFNYKKMAFETKLKNGWVISTEEKKLAA